MKKCKHNLHITSLTWPKESNELFDYESQEVTKQEFNISTPCSFFRNKNQIDYQGKDLNETVNPIQQGESLFYIDNSLTDFYFNTHSFSTNSNLILDEKPEREKTWISLKNFKNKKYNNNGYILNPGDVIKFGRVTLKVREIQLEGRKKGNGNIYDLYKDITKPCLINSIKKEKNNKKKKICRICYCDEKEVDSPLLNPCKCLGGLKYIHLSCLQQWLKSKSTFSSSSNDYCTIYTFNQIACELCKQVFPDFIKVDHTFYQIWDFSESKFKNYISLDTLPLNGQKSIYIISFDKKNEIKIGRSHESDLRITDVTVSRMHCQITKTNENEVVLEDCNSKFGSLVFLQIKKLRILPYIILPIQIGRTFLTFSLRNTFNICYCLKFFDKKKCDNIDDYAKINSQQITIENILSVKIQNNLEDSEDNSSNEEKKEKNLPKEIIIKEEEKEENILNLNNERQIDEINTLNLASLEIKKKSNQNITNTNGFSDDDRIISGTKSQFGNSCFQSFQNVINHIEQQ
jgi:hypothetical protein